MRICNNCGSPIEDGKNFCVKCGARAVPEVNQNGPRPQAGEKTQIPPQRVEGDPSNGTMNKKGAKKNNSKKPIIISCVAAGVVVVAVITYFVVAFSMQSSLSSKVEELDKYINKGVELSQINQALYDEANNDKHSLNAFALSKDKSKVNDLIDMSKVYVESKKTLDNSTRNMNDLIDSLEASKIDYENLDGYKALAGSLQKLKAAMADNNVAEMKKESKNVDRDYNVFKGEEGSKVTEKSASIEDAKRKLQGWKNTLDTYDSNASTNDVSDDIVVDSERSSVVSYMDEYQSYLDENDLDSANGIEENIISHLATYNNEINNAIKEKKEEEAERDSFDYSSVEAKDDYYALDTIDTELISGNPFDNYGLTEKQKFCLLVIAKNEVFAKRGYVFGTKLSKYFANREWYEPDRTVSDAKIMKELKNENSIEYKNLNKIQKLIDKYAKKYSWAGKTVRTSKVSASDFEDAIQALYNY